MGARDLLSKGSIRKIGNGRSTMPSAYQNNTECSERMGVYEEVMAKKSSRISTVELDQFMKYTNKGLSQLKIIL